MHINQKQRGAAPQATFARYPGHREAYHILRVARLIDDEAPNFLRKNLGWSYHAPCAGHEAIQLALGCTFRPSVDYLFPYYRDLCTVLAGGITPTEIILNGLSKADDVAGGGRHMSNHFAKPSIHIQNVSSAVSNHFQHAAGLGRAVKHYKKDAVVYASIGESSASEGYVFEAINGASREKLPVVFVMQDNGYGIGVPKHEQSANDAIAENFAGIANVRIEYCDGRDVFDCFRAMQSATEYAQSGQGPAIVYAECVRIGAHSNSDNHRLYRSQEEIEEAKTHDPLPIFRDWLLKNGGVTEAELEAIEIDALAEMKAAVKDALDSPEPDPGKIYEHLVPPAYDAVETPVAQESGAEEEGEICTLREAINKALKGEFRRNPDTFMWGQDMANGDKEGIFKVSDGMQKEFGKERVFNAPIAENYILGTADGFSRLDKKIRVVVEGAEFADYIWPGFDQVIELSHEYWRTNGQFAPNVTVRLASSGNIGGGLYHSQNIESVLANLPGLRIVQPAFADDAAGLLRTCMRSEGCTFFLEPKYLYNLPATRTRVTDDFVVPFGKGRTRREGTDVTVIGYGTAIHHAMKAADAVANDGISVHIFDLRSLNPLDKDGICNAVSKTNRVVVAHEDKIFGGFGGEIAAWISEGCFEHLDAPVVRVGQDYIPVPFHKQLEAAMQLNPARVEKAIRKVASY
ncbi:MAG: alpha-ketoacid dehydrogenase subunit alpha/beta [Planctomycetota bacterium]|jgi:2-oxoisovalerate dehydrogenase E1 component